MRHGRRGLTRALIGHTESDPPADGGTSVFQAPPSSAREHRDDRRDAKTPAGALLRSGLFDLAFYSAASGEVFPDRRAAAWHCANSGMPAGLSPNPLLSLGSLPPRLQKAWLRGQVVKVLDYLANERHWDRPIGPLFHPRRSMEQSSRDDDQPDETPALPHAIPLANFLARARSNTPLPAPDGSWGRVATYGAARSALIDHARMTDAQERDLSTADLDLHGPISTPWRRDPSRVQLLGTGVPVVTVIARLAGSISAARAAVMIMQGQTLLRWELLLVGRVPPEGIPELRDGRVRVVPLDDEPVGVPGTAGSSCDADWRNAGLAAAEGSYIAFMTPGHHWRPDFLLGAVEWLHDAGQAAGHAAVSLHDASGRATVMSGQGDVSTLRLGGFVDIGSLVARTDAAREAGGFEPALGSGADVEFAIQLAMRAPLAAFPFVASDRLVSMLPSQEVTAAGADGDWLAVIGKAWVNWAEVAAAVPDRRTDRVSVVVPTYRDSAMTIAAVTTLLATSSVADLEILVIDNGSALDVGQRLTAAFVTEPRVLYRRLPVNLNFAIACNVGLGLSTGATVVFLNNDTRSDTDWLPQVVAHLEDPTVAGAQPVLLYPDGTIQTAGSIFPLPDGLACHFLTGHPPADAAATATMAFSAATAAALAMRASDLCELTGFDPHYVNGMEDVDLCLRALALRPGGFRVEPRSELTHLEGKTPGRGKRIPQNRLLFMERWSGRLPGPELDKFAAAGFSVLRIEDDGQPIPSPRPVITPLRSSE